MLLNVERPQDAAEYWEPGSPLQAQLTADEVRNEQREEGLTATVLVLVFA